VRTDAIGSGRDACSIRRATGATSMRSEIPGGGTAWPRAASSFMPLGMRREEQQARMSAVIEWCAATGFRFSPRLQSCSGAQARRLG